MNSEVRDIRKRYFCYDCGYELMSEAYLDHDQRHQINVSEVVEDEQ